MSDKPKDNTEAIANFDKAAKNWEANPVRLEMAVTIANAIMADIDMRPDMRVMDFGCGTGLLARILSDHVSSVLAVDTSAGMIDELKRHISDSRIANICAQRIDDISFLNEKFDLIASAMVMHHIADPAVELRKFFALLAPGGYLSVADLETESGDFHGDASGVYHKGFDPESFGQMARNAGFELVSTRRVYTVRRPSPPDGELRDYPVFLMTAQKPL